MAAASTLSSTSCAAAPGPVGLIVSGVLFSAQTGIEYRKYKRGEMTKDEFKKSTKKGAIMTSGSLVGSTGGMVGGFFAGQLLIPIPVVGGIIGAFAGGFAGGMTGAKVSLKWYEKMEARMAARGLSNDPKLKQAVSEEDQAKYENSLEILGIESHDPFSVIQEQYELQVKSFASCQGTQTSEETIS